MQAHSNIFGYFQGEKIEFVITDELEGKSRIERIGESLLMVVSHVDTFMANENYPTAISEAYHAFLFRQSKAIIEKCVKKNQVHFKTKPKKIVIDRSINKWGSCNQDRVLAFNYLLASKSPVAINYVVVHEMCHMVHLNHDRSFWRLLGSIIPNYKEVEMLLNGKSID
ncbi:MAG TPA: hypothetical protein DCS67_07105 [Clostridiales bacterium UBA8960]|nr:hypothetical protein [Clostridiales bacterium UBA8960]